MLSFYHHAGHQTTEMKLFTSEKLKPVIKLMKIFECNVSGFARIHLPCSLIPCAKMSAFFPSLFILFITESTLPETSRPFH